MKIMPEVRKDSRAQLLQEGRDGADSCSTGLMDPRNMERRRNNRLVLKKGLGFPLIKKMINPFILEKADPSAVCLYSLQAVVRRLDSGVGPDEDKRGNLIVAIEQSMEKHAPTQGISEADRLFSREGMEGVGYHPPGLFEDFVFVGCGALSMAG